MTLNLCGHRLPRGIDPLRNGNVLDAGFEARLVKREEPLFSGVKTWRGNVIDYVLGMANTEIRVQDPMFSMGGTLEGLLGIAIAQLSHQFL